MSDYETHFGTLKKVDLGGLTLEEKCKELCEIYNIPWHDWYDDYRDLLMDTKSESYIILNNTLYEINDTRSYDDFYCNVKDDGNGNYSYYTHFYNGGTYLQECLEEELSKMEN